MRYTDYPDSFMDLVLGGANGPQKNEAEEAADFLATWTKYITDIINLLMSYFDQLFAGFKK